jgi:hypothetical protein
MDKQVARLLIKHLQVRTRARVQRLAAPPRASHDTPSAPQSQASDSGLRAERVMSPQAVALAKRQLDRNAFRHPNVAASIEAYPRIVERLCQLWGYREIRPYLEGLVLVEASRVERQGLDPKAQEELMFLYQLTEDRAELLFALEERDAEMELSALYHFAR